MFCEILLSLASLSGITYVISEDFTDSEKGYKLVWNDEFDKDGAPDPSIWNYENGFVRNHELQWYEPECASINGGILTIEAKKVSRKNPWFEKGSSDWRKSRSDIEYASACITTKGKRHVKFGKICVRARIPVGEGAWPAIWLLGETMEWPSCGEIDIMEYYRYEGKPTILANACWGNDKKYDAVWNSQKIPYDHFLNKDPFWAEKFHIWSMEWDKDAIKLYLDDELLNVIDLHKTVNGKIGKGKNPFHQPHFLLLNLAIGGDNGGTPDIECYPLKYEIDYVRVYEKESSSN